MGGESRFRECWWLYLIGVLLELTHPRPRASTVACRAAIVLAVDQSLRLVRAVPRRRRLDGFDHYCYLLRAPVAACNLRAFFVFLACTAAYLGVHAWEQHQLLRAPSALATLRFLACSVLFMTMALFTALQAARTRLPRAFKDSAV